MEALNSHDWFVNWTYGIYILTLLFCFRLCFNKEFSTSIIPYFPQQFNYILLIVIIVYFASEPIVLYSDKWNYEDIFTSIVEKPYYAIDIEKGFYFYNKGISYLSNSVFIYFLLTAFIYTVGYLNFINKTFVSSYRSIVFIMVVSSLGFYVYGTNTIRQGLALSMFMFILFEKKISLRLVLGSLIVVFFHKSLIFLVAVNFFLNYFNRKDNYIKIWGIFLFVSILFGDLFVNTFGDFLSSSDQRMAGYLNNTFENYETGFKLNFLIYSTLPIVFGLMVKKRGFVDEFYNKIFSMYILVNALWLLVIKLPFTDRFAYLSWFLIPFIFIYPLSKKIIFKNQNLWIAGIIMIIASVNLFISVK